MQDTYLRYPANLVQSVPAKPGDGSKVRALIITFGTQPKGADQNKLWKAVNDAAGVDLELTLVADMDWQVKVAATMASGDLPDIIMLGYSGITMPNEAQFLQEKCEPLGQYLAGAAGAAAYPNLAAIPPYSWDAMGRVGGDYYAVPINRPTLGNSWYADADQFSAAGIWQPSSGTLKKDDLTAGLIKLNTQNHFSLGCNQGSTFNVGTHAGFHGAPNGWTLSGGQFTTAYASDAYTAAIATVTDWYKMQDGLNQIITAKAPLSSWDGLLKKWRNGGGDAIASELAAEYAKTHS